MAAEAPTTVAAPDRPETPAAPPPGPVAGEGVSSGSAPASPATSPAADTPPSTETPAETPEPPDWRAVLEKVDPQELLTHRAIGGLVGSRLEAERQRARQEGVEEARRRDQDERLRDLRRQDPAAYAAEIEAQEEEAGRRNQVYGGIHARIATWQQSLPEPVQQAVSRKTYPGSYEDGVLAYTRDVAEAYAAHKSAEAVTAAKKTWEKEVRAAIRQELLAELNGGEPAPDTSGGGAPTSNGFRLPERVDLAWVKSLPQSVYKAHMKEIDAALFGSGNSTQRR